MLPFNLWCLSREVHSSSDSPTLGDQKYRPPFKQLEHSVKCNSNYFALCSDCKTILCLIIIFISSVQNLSRYTDDFNLHIFQGPVLNAWPFHFVSGWKKKKKKKCNVSKIPFTVIVTSFAWSAIVCRRSSAILPQCQNKCAAKREPRTWQTTESSTFHWKCMQNTLHVEFE